MYPYLHIGSFQLGTFGLLLWLAAVAGTCVLYRAFVRDGIDTDALNVVALTVISGVIGAKLWHELQAPSELALAMHRVGLPGWKAPLKVLINFLIWFQAGFAWFGGLLAGIAMLMYQGAQARPNGLTGLRAGVRMLDLATAAAAVGYGVGRIGCMLSGDGDYGLSTTSAWGVHLSPQALVPVAPGTKVLPTPFWELAIALVLGAIFWRLARRARPLGWLTGVYLVLTGVARFIVEFWRVNPKNYFGDTLSNAQVAALGSILIGAMMVAVQRKKAPVGGSALRPEPMVQPVATNEIAAECSVRSASARH